MEGESERRMGNGERSHGMRKDRIINKKHGMSDYATCLSLALCLEVM
jgi:hypothetical protein